MRAASAAVVSWARAIVPHVDVPDFVPSIPGRAQSEGTFRWAVKPRDADLPLLATFYTDGSALDGYARMLARYGWSFVVVDNHGRIVAAAHGVPPAWVESVAAAEAWALVQAALVARPGSVYKTDCLAVLKSMRAGRVSATAHDRPLARVMAKLFNYFEDADEAASVVWLPGHTTAADVGRTALSDGSALTEVDHLMNAKADLLAKAAAREQRVQPAARAAHVARYLMTQRLALYIGRMTKAANGAGNPPLRDAEPVPARHRQAAERRAQPERPPSIGGHVLVPRRGGGWSCHLCWKHSAVREKIAHETCGGDVFRKWADREAELAGHGSADATTHTLRITGDVVWCAVCAAYGSERAVGLAAPCRGRPPRGAEFGRHTKLARLRKRACTRKQDSRWPRAPPLLPSPLKPRQQRSASLPGASGSSSAFSPSCRTASKMSRICSSALSHLPPPPREWQRRHVCARVVLLLPRHFRVLATAAARRVGITTARRRTHSSGWSSFAAGSSSSRASACTVILVPEALMITGLGMVMLLMFGDVISAWLRAWSFYAPGCARARPSRSGWALHRVSMTRPAQCHTRRNTEGLTWRLSALATRLTLP